jgi:NNP family nitrate/nitrite transporter-like MFS transporter
MPLLSGAIAAFGFTRFTSWRLAMILPGLLMLFAGVFYYFFTEDTPDGRPFTPRMGMQAMWEAAADFRVWLLFVLYGACFGIEITVDNVAALYFKDSFHTTLTLAGLLAGLTGMMNVFARALGGMAGDWAGNRWGFEGRTRLLGAVILAEGLSLTFFSLFTGLGSAVAAFALFGLFVCMACGATYAVAPLIQPRSIGSVSGIVGAGGNVGAVLAAMLFKSEGISGDKAFFILGITISICAFCALLIRPMAMKASGVVESPETERPAEPVAAGEYA